MTQKQIKAIDRALKEIGITRGPLAEHAAVGSWNGIPVSLWLTEVRQRAYCGVYIDDFRYTRRIAVWEDGGERRGWTIYLK